MRHGVEGGADERRQHGSVVGEVVAADHGEVARRRAARAGRAPAGASRAVSGPAPSVAPPRSSDANASRSAARSGSARSGPTVGCPPVPLLRHGQGHDVRGRRGDRAEHVGGVGARERDVAQRSDEPQRRLGGALGQDAVEAVLRRELLHDAGAALRDAEDAPAVLARRRGRVLGEHRLVRPVERAQAEVDQPDAHVRGVDGGRLHPGRQPGVAEGRAREPGRAGRGGHSPAADDCADATPVEARTTSSTPMSTEAGTSAAPSDPIVNAGAACRVRSAAVSAAASADSVAVGTEPASMSRSTAARPSRGQRDGDGGERRRDQGRRRDVVVPHDRDVLGDPHAACAQPAQDAEREQVVVREDRGDAARGDQVAGRDAAAEQGREVPEVDHVDAAQAVRRVLEPAPPLGVGPRADRAAGVADAAVAERVQVRRPPGGCRRCCR